MSAKPAKPMHALHCIQCTLKSSHQEVSRGANAMSEPELIATEAAISGVPSALNIDKPGTRLLKVSRSCVYTTIYAVFAPQHGMCTV